MVRLVGFMVGFCVGEVGLEEVGAGVGFAVG
jgi:hypothetical protein